jgi:hypothetical protein
MCEALLRMYFDALAGDAVPLLDDDTVERQNGTAHKCGNQQLHRALIGDIDVTPDHPRR